MSCGFIVHFFLIGQNKRLFLQLGVVDVGLSLLKQSTQAHVQLKALGLLRLLVEKQGIIVCNCLHFFQYMIIIKLQIIIHYNSHVNIIFCAFIYNCSRNLLSHNI